MNKLDARVLMLAQGVIEKDHQSCLKKFIEIRRLMECARLTTEGYQHYIKQFAFYQNRLTINQNTIRTENQELILILALIRIYQLIYFRSFLFV